MRVFSFPWLGVSMLADSPSEWSKCTGKLLAYWSRLRWKKLWIGSDMQPNDFFFSFNGCFWACTHTHLLLRSKSKFHPWGAKVLHLSCYSKPSACKVLNISLNIIVLSSLSDINNNKVMTPTSPLKYHAALYSEAFVKDRHTGALLTPKGVLRLYIISFISNTSLSLFLIFLAVSFLHSSLSILQSVWVHLFSYAYMVHGQRFFQRAQTTNPAGNSTFLVSQMQCVCERKY